MQLPVTITPKTAHENNINHALVARIKAHMFRKGLNPKTLAEKANVGRSFVYDILNGKSANPTSTKLAAIAEQLGVSVQYLLTGSHQVMGDKYKEWNDVVEVASLDIEMSTSGCVVVTKDNYLKPYYFRNDWIARRLKSKPEELRAVYVKGDAMAPTLQNGDMVLINVTSKIPTPPGIFVLFDGAGFAVKRVEMSAHNSLRIISDNPQYSAFEKDIYETNIIGRVVWVAREMQ